MRRSKANKRSFILSAGEFLSSESVEEARSLQAAAAEDDRWKINR